MTRLSLLTAAALVLAAVCGCGGPKFVPVSGVVSLDGKPYDKAVVTFQPIGGSDNPYPGRGSSAFTDASGRYELICDDVKGAVVGKHRVRIMTRGNDVVLGSTEGGTPDDAPTGRTFDPIPPEWNALSEKEFDVPAGGTDKANFEIVTKK